MSELNTLANSANKLVPTPQQDAKSIDALVKKGGRVIGYHLADGTTVTREEGVSLAKQGQIRGVAVAENKGTEYLRTLPDGEENNNLSSLPTVKI